MKPVIDADIVQTIDGTHDPDLLDTVDNYVLTAIAVSFIWHCFITFDQGVAFFWKRRPSGASALFFANRYLTLAIGIYNTAWWPTSIANRVG
ncbi:uncharacterized protein TRAVEDRAFT_53531 [Trametes versicolor FP-101664 SS1]|uniref:uncharacterized protein n=1 Tax=Trametes versicolor (strain FP-101664) TaxID=717944 RepID=UPI00046241E4|nr:uncharacterized protein TRAVEDRAFT_53531 [Trametes versicolor FP-101664 SS1]EIW53119.1 hypothetical protein TRAVEDRAFT_53531 [Trametes versicolor FP-101664 SS1]